MYRSRKIAEIVLNGGMLKEAASKFELSITTVRLFVHQFCQRQNPELYYQLRSRGIKPGAVLMEDKVRKRWFYFLPKIEVLRKEKKKFLGE